MIDGITYFRKNSPYPGDVTKNCALDGVEVDNNFFVLEGRDIKTLRVEGSDIVVELQNGKVMRSVDALKDVTDLKHTAVSELEFDKEALYKNMIDAKADWLYELPQWDEIFDAETKKKLYREAKNLHTVRNTTKVGRNDPCPCGSGRKYKQCCGKK